jgi:hypothetical protein
VGVRVGAAIGVSGLLLAGCTSPSKHVVTQGPASTTSRSPSPSPVGSPSVASSSPAAATSSAPLASSASTPAAASSSANGLSTPGPTGPLRVFGDIAIKGAFDVAGAGLIAAQGPDGAVFVAGQPASPQIVWVVDGVRPAAIAEHVPGPVAALAADAANLYVGVGTSVSAYSRTTGALVRSWAAGAMPGTVSQLVVAGDRVWALYGESDAPPPAPNGLAEIDPSSPKLVRTVSGITDVFSIAPGDSGVYYVTKQSTLLVEQTNAGRAVSAPTRQHVDLELSGPSAIQAVAVVGAKVVLQHNAGQGLDAVLNTYDASTLAGPSADIGFSAAEQLAATPDGLFVIGNSDTNVCATGQQTCVRRFGLPAGNVGEPLALLTDAETSELTGPYPTVVIAAGSDVHVVRIS